MQHKQLLSIEEVVIETGICRTNVYAQMKAVKIGRRTFVRPDDLRAFIASAPGYVPHSAA